MALAVALGSLIAIGRVYGDRMTRMVLTAYVEVMRGTPVLLQLFVIYYGLASVIRLPAFIAARQLPRIVRHCVSLQSWMTWDIR